MNIRGRLAGHLKLGRVATPVPVQVPVPDILHIPATWSPGPDMPDVTTKVDHALRVGRNVVVGAWSSQPAQYRLRVGARPVPTTTFATARPDVAHYLGRGDDEQLGVVLLAEDAGDGDVELECLGATGLPVATYLLEVRDGVPGADARAQLAPALLGLEDPPSEEAGPIAAAPPRTAFAAGVLDDVRSSEDNADAVATGWLVARSGVDSWIEAPGGRRFPLTDAHRVRRTDVQASLSSARPSDAATTGFLARLPGVAPGDRLELCVSEEDGKTRSLSEATCSSWGADPVVASRWLFEFPTPMSELAGRMAAIDVPVVSGLIEASQRDWPRLPVREVALGSGPVAPRASIVIPLYGRLDFVEHQLMEFARDRWLLDNTEIVYVVDDPALVEAMASTAWTLHRLYGVPFRWLWGQVNRGFAGANNLGASRARGDVLLFLNSDAIPRGPGWLEPLLDALAADPEIGAVGPRLLYGDGSIQHAGMDFRHRDDLGIWTNHHPGMGQDPSLDPNRGPTDVPCVTGACLALRRADFDRVGGWDTGYLVGDFEDSDLCLKLREAGQRIVYLPQVELTHLERQSFRLLGKGDYRMRVVVWNAVRHQERWRPAIEALAGSHGGGGN